MGKKLYNVLTSVFVVLIVILALVLVGVRLFGLTPYAVLSGSMEPEYPTGSLIYVQGAEPEQIQSGDAITFVLDEQLTVATHRVIGIDLENQQFHTKGDANQTPDAQAVHFRNLLGKPVFCIPYLGYVSLFLSSGPGIVTAVVVIGVLLVLVFLPDIKKRKSPLRDEDHNPKH